MKYRKKPVEIEAFRAGYEPYPAWLEEALLDGTVVPGDGGVNPYYAQIKTLEGVMTVNFGDWIIKGVNGELYPCKDDIFRKTYEVAEYA